MQKPGDMGEDGAHGHHLSRRGPGKIAVGREVLPNTQRRPRFKKYTLRLHPCVTAKLDCDPRPPFSPFSCLLCISP